MQYRRRRKPHPLRQAWAALCALLTPQKPKPRRRAVRLVIRDDTPPDGGDWKPYVPPGERETARRAMERRQRWTRPTAAAPGQGWVTVDPDPAEVRAKLAERTVIGIAPRAWGDAGKTPVSTLLG